MGHEIFNPESKEDESPWKCEYCGAPKPKNKKRNIKDEEDLREYKKNKQRERRKKYDISLRPEDHKAGSAYLHGTPKKDTEDEKKEIKKECNRLRLKTVEEKYRIMACEY